MGCLRLSVTAVIPSSPRLALQDKYGHTPLSYLPREAKLIGRNAPIMDGSQAVCAVQAVGRGHPVTLGSVAQGSAIHMSGASRR
jgi:hypothetical protein